MNFSMLPTNTFVSVRIGNRFLLEMGIRVVLQKTASPEWTGGRDVAQWFSPPKAFGSRG